MLPRRAVDTPEELAQLGQFVVNIIDFRDPDCTITMWTNPDVQMVYLQNSTPPSKGTPPTAPNPPYLYFNNGAPPANSTAYPFVHYGMEYNPVAINEVLAYSFSTTVPGAPSQVKRIFVELVNTLTQTAVNAYSVLSAAATPVPDASTLDLGGFNSAAAALLTPADPYSGGCWDLVFTGDDPASRPDPYRGDLLVQGPQGQFPVRRSFPIFTGWSHSTVNPLARRPMSTWFRWPRPECRRFRAPKPPHRPISTT